MRSINYREYIVRNAMALCVRVISRSYRATGANEGYTGARVYVHTRARVCVYTRPLLSIQGWLISACASLTDRYGPGINDTRHAFLFPNEEENEEQKEIPGEYAKRRRIFLHTPGKRLTPRDRMIELIASACR